MASPLRWFRKHQQIMMVFFGVGLMAIFGLGSVFTMLDPSRLAVGRDNPLIATWKYGNITRDDLARIQKNHFAASRFLSEVQQVAQSQSETPIQPMAPMIRSIQTGNDFNQDEVDQEILKKMMLQKYAEKEGIIISDGMVEDYITLLTGRSELTRDDLQAANKRVNQTSNLDVVYEQLKMELAAMKVEELATTIPLLPLYQGFPPTINPTEAVELFERTARQVECQVLPIDVDPESVTATPSDSELKELFEEGKTKLARLDGLEPGFRVPPKINVGYFVADAETYIQNEIAKLTDKQVQEEYDKLVKEGDSLVMERIIDEDNSVELPSGAGDSEGTDSGDAASDAKDDVEAKSSDEDANQKEGAEDSSQGEEKGSEESNGENGAGNQQSLKVVDSKSAFVALQDQEKKEETKKEETKKEEAKQEEAKKEASKTEEPKKETTQEEKKEVPPAKEAAKEEAGEKKQIEESANKSSEATDPPAKQEDNSTGSEPGDQQKEMESTGDAKQAEDAKQEDQTGLPTLEDTPEPEFRQLPLKEVADKIKRKLAIPKADKQMASNLMLAERELGSYRYDYQRFQSAQDGEDISDPGPFDGKKWAEKYNLKYGETSLLTMSEMEKSAIGTLSIPVTMDFGGRPISIQLPLFRTLFDQFNELTVFTSRESSDPAGSKYRYWVVETQDTYVPEFEEVKEQVVAFWKKKKAYDNALEDAKKIVEELRASNSNLATKFPEKSKPTGQFSWFNTLGQLRINNVEELPAADNDLMKTVFALNEGEFGYAPNGPHEKVFVIEMLNTGDSRVAIADEYLNDQFFKIKSIPADVSAASDFYAREYANKWITEIYDEFDFQPAE